MIVVVEGISAAGKTTWCRSHAKPYLIPETFPDDRKAQPETGLATARYWTDWNAKRWRDALVMERARGHAVCDTDPLKLHYSWSLSQIGVLPKSQWDLQLQESRQAITERKLGFADAYFVKIIDPITARQQSDADPSRVRDRFEASPRRGKRGRSNRESEVGSTFPAVIDVAPIFCAGQLKMIAEINTRTLANSTMTTAAPLRKDV